MLLEMLLSVDEDFESKREDDGLFILDASHRNRQVP